jgi:hypothetical protein
LKRKKAPPLQMGLPKKITGPPNPAGSDRQLEKALTSVLLPDILLLSQFYQIISFNILVLLL